MATNPVSCSQHPKPFLKKGEGATGRIMQQIRYPVLARRQSCQISPTQISVRDTGCETMDQNSHLSPVSSIEEHTTSLQYDMKVNQNDGATSTVEENENTNHEISESLSREHKSSSSQRPTTRTTDSGCPNDDYPDSVILSPDEAHKHTHNATICPDVSDVNASDAAQSINSNHGNTVQSIITGSSSKLEDVGLSLPLSSPRSEIVVDVSQPSIGESTVDFECVEKCLERSEINTPGGEYGGLLSDGSSASTDGTRSRYWKIGLRRFRREASKNQEFPSNYSTSNSAFSSRTPSTAASIDSSLPCSVSSKHSEESHALKLRRSTREGKPHPLKVQSVSTKQQASLSDGSCALRPSSVSDSQSSETIENFVGSPEYINRVSHKPVGRIQQIRLRRIVSSPAIESLNEGDAESPGGRLAQEVLSRHRETLPNVVQEKYATSPKVVPILNREECNLAARLKDLITHLDVVNEENRQRTEEIEQMFEILCESNDDLKQERAVLLENERKLKERLAQREEDVKKLQEIDEHRLQEIERLKRTTGLLERRQRMKENGESEIIKLLKEQIDDGRKTIRELERQRIDLRSQKRKSDISLQDKDKKIEELKNEKKRMEKYIGILSNTLALRRGRQAKVFMENAAIQRAANKPSNSMSVKLLNGEGTREKENVAPNQAAEPCADTIGHVRNNQSRESPIINERNGQIRAPVTHRVTHPVSDDIQQIPISKSVHWNEPLATTAVFTPASTSFTLSDILNESATSSRHAMQLVRCESISGGHSSLYTDSKGNFTVHTQKIPCGCNFYQYSNTDTRWIHSTKDYEVNYYGQAGATTIDLFKQRHLIRHFLCGQLEIYRPNGETTLVSSNGRRVEVICDENGTLRIEIYELDGTTRIIDRSGKEVVMRNTTETSCYRTDGSYVIRIESDRSYEWRAIEYVVRWFSNGDVKVRLNLIDTTVTMLNMNVDVGTVKHLTPSPGSTQKYCAEWGRIVRERSRQQAAVPAQHLSGLSQL